LGRLGTSAAASVLLKLINSQGVQNLLYGISATSLSKLELTSFTHAYNSVFSKIFKSFDDRVIMCCQFYCKYLCFDLLLDLHRYMLLSKLVINGCIDSRSELDRPDYKDYIDLKSKYNFHDSDSLHKIKLKVWKRFENYNQDMMSN